MDFHLTPEEEAFGDEVRAGVRGIHPIGRLPHPDPLSNREVIPQAPFRRGVRISFRAYFPVFMATYSTLVPRRTSSSIESAPPTPPMAAR